MIFIIYNSLFFSSSWICTTPGWRGGSHAGVSAAGEGEGTRRGKGRCPRGGGTSSPLSTPSSGNFLSRCKTQKESKGIKRKAFNSSDVFPGSHRRGRPRPKAPPLSPAGVSCSEPSAPLRPRCSVSQALRDCPLASPLPGTVPVGRLSSLIASEAAGGGCGLPPGNPCGAGDRWWHRGDTPDCAIGSLPGREQGADTGGDREGERPSTGRTGREIKQ